MTTEKKHSKDILADALRQADLHDMAEQAALGYYHDYLSPLAFPSLQLAKDLQKAGTPGASFIHKQHTRGVYDATKEEGDEWVNSSDGRDAMSLLKIPKFLRREKKVEKKDG